MREDGKPRSKNKYCQFHEDYGHETENCRNLAQDIESLVRNGQLKKYQDRSAGVNQVDAPRSQKKKRQYKGGSCSTETEKKVKYEDDADEDGDYQYDGIVATISALAKGQTKSSLKNGARNLPNREPANKRFKTEEAVTFSAEDPVPPMVPHSDAIVIEAVVANKLIRRIHFDTGASVNIMFKHCDNMELDKSKVMPTTRPLRSFAQEETHPLGTIELPVTVGKGPRSTTDVTEFVVVEAKSPYNIILGRTWMNAVRGGRGGGDPGRSESSEGVPACGTQMARGTAPIAPSIAITELRGAEEDVARRRERGGLIRRRPR